MPVNTIETDSHGEYDPARSPLIIENEVLLMKLRAEFGAKIFLPDQRVDPELENHFLRTIYDYEQQSAAGREREIIFHRVGEPVFADEKNLSDQELSVQLRDVQSLLYDHKIVLDTLAEYPAREIYRFITTEFLHMEIDIAAFNDCYIHYCYEDFYPNHDYDLRQLSRFFLSYLMDDLQIVPRTGLYTRVRTSLGMMVGYKEALKVIESSFADFKSRVLESFEISNLSVLEDLGLVDFRVSYQVTLDDSEQQPICGEGRFEFVFSDDSWWISFFRFPGIVI